MYGVCRRPPGRAPPHPRQQKGAYALENAASLAATAALVSWASAACIKARVTTTEISFIKVSLSARRLVCPSQGVN